MLEDKVFYVHVLHANIDFLGTLKTLLFSK